LQGHIRGNDVKRVGIKYHWLIGIQRLHNERLSFFGLTQATANHNDRSACEVGRGRTKHQFWVEHVDRGSVFAHGVNRDTT